MPFMLPTQAEPSIPAGTIVMWSGSIASIPAGWFFCNGQNGTPDLRNRFIVAANADAGGIAKSTIENGSAKQTGGTKSHAHNFGVSITFQSGPGPLAAGTGYINGGGAGGQTEPIAELVPPFYALAYIMKGSS